MDAVSIRLPYRHLKQAADAELELVVLNGGDDRNAWASTTNIPISLPSGDPCDSPLGSSSSDSKSSRPNQRSSMKTLVLSCMVGAGVQFGWALQLSLLTPYIQTLGIPHALSSFIWLCGPITGLIVQPCVGIWSDKCRLKLGRRRPFILAGCIMISFSVTLIGFAADFGYLLGDTDQDCMVYIGPRWRAVTIFIIGFWMLDLANNTVQGPARALLADLSGPDQCNSANAIFCSWMALGNILGYSAGASAQWQRWFPFLRTKACCEACANLKAAFLVAVVFLMFCMAVTLYFAKEIPLEAQFTQHSYDSAPLLKDSQQHERGSPHTTVGRPENGHQSEIETGKANSNGSSDFNSNVKHDKTDALNDGPSAVLVNLLTSLRHLPPGMHSVLLVMALTWTSWFPFFLFDTDWMGREVYHGDPNGDQSKKDAYQSGVREGAFGLLLNSVVLGISSFLIAPMCRRMGSKVVWAISNFIVFICMAATTIISFVSLSNFSDGIQQVLGANKSIKIATLIIFSVLGFPLAVTYSVPFSVTAELTAGAGGGQGLATGVLNLAIVVPQIIVSIGAGPWDELFGGGNIPAFFLASVFALAGNEVWNPTINTASYASMLDTGNFVLWSAGSGMIWQTFDHPTDTILPGQVLNQNATLFSKLMDDDYSQGRFVLTLQNDGNLVLNLVAYPTDFKYDAYWSTLTPASGNNVLVFNASTGSIYLSYPKGGSNGSMVTVFGDVSGDNYLRATLDPDGGFRQYSYPKSSSKLIDGTWKSMNTVGLDICNTNFGTGSGACGFNSYCVLNSGGRATCICPDHYSFIDPARQYKGCKPDFAPQTCEPGGEATFNFTTVENLDWPFSDAEHFSPMNQTECTDNCIQDCFCAVAIHINSDCWKKKFPLSNGKIGRDIVDRVAFIKYSTVSNSSTIRPSTDSKTDWKTWVFVVSGILGGSIALNLVQMGACCFVFRRNRRLLLPNSASITGPALRSFTYKELEEATKGFSEELGKGAFGTVYKGALPSQPTTLIAVKKLEESLLEEAEKDFTNEVATIAQTHHKNLVRLLGFCKEGGHRLMVFEYMSNGSLNKFIFGNDLRPDWNRRVQIALGISSGLAYLHEECRTQIIHCDIKPQNILLDENLEARISDFGLAKLLRLDQTRTSTGIRGTIGYFAPEWFKNVAVTTKVDVYSFGVMLLEIICCRRNFEWGLESQDKATVTDLAKECYRNGRLDLLVEDDEEAKRDGMRLERFVLVGISCIQDEPWFRPSMKKVVQMLEGSIAVPIPPNMHSVRS